jgi:hypothetical protein
MTLPAPYETPDAVVVACRAATILAPIELPPDLPASKIFTDAPEWYGFEHSAWRIGANIQQSFQANPKLKKDVAVIQAILGVIQVRNLRRGRESFVMLLGFTGAAKHAPLLAEFLHDPDISGHVLNALLKMRVSGYAPQVANFLNHNRVWIRQLAQRYIDRYPAPFQPGD